MRSKFLWFMDENRVTYMAYKTGQNQGYIATQIITGVQQGAN